MDTGLYRRQTNMVGAIGSLMLSLESCREGQTCVPPTLAAAVPMNVFVLSLFIIIPRWTTPLSQQ